MGRSSCCCTDSNAVTGAWVVWEMNTEVRQGTLQKRLLRPVHPLLTYLTENLAAIPMRFIR